MLKYIFVSGGVISGIGKGITVSSIALLLKASGYKVTPLKFENSFYCRHCGEMESIKTCPHPQDEHFSLSGTKVRELLASGEVPPPEFTRSEIADILIDWFISSIYLER